jgi:crossover junction endonuclease MUS81
MHFNHHSLISFNFIATDKNINVEAILDYIVERKRLDDLSKSIIDGRYNEQKVDKSKEKLNQSNLDYLVSS